MNAGKVLPAPEAPRRTFLKGTLALSAGALLNKPANAADPAILELPAHSTGLGQPVVARGYGLPSVHEKNVQRRQSPGLTRVSQSSVSFTPLQGLFGIVTPSGLHFERHHQAHDHQPVLRRRSTRWTT